MATLTPSKRSPVDEAEEQPENQNVRVSQQDGSLSGSPKKRARVVSRSTNVRKNSRRNENNNQPVTVLNELTVNATVNTRTTTATTTTTTTTRTSSTTEPAMPIDANTDSHQHGVDNVDDDCGGGCCFPSLQLVDSRDMDPASLAAKKRQTLDTLYGCFATEQVQQTQPQEERLDHHHHHHHVTQDSMEQILQSLKQTCQISRSSVLVELVGRHSHDDDNHHHHLVGVATLHAAQNYTAAAVGIITSSSMDVYRNVARQYLAFMETPWLRNHRVALLHAVPNSSNKHALVDAFEPFPFATHFLIHGAPGNELLQWMACASACTTVVVVMYHHGDNNSENHDEHAWLPMANQILNVTAMHRLEHLQDTHGHACEAFVLQRIAPQEQRQDGMTTMTTTCTAHRQEARPLVEVFVAGSVQDAKQAYRNVLLATKPQEEAEVITVQNDNNDPKQNTTHHRDEKESQTAAVALNRWFASTEKESPEPPFSITHASNTKRHFKDGHEAHGQQYHQDELDPHTALLPPSSFLSPKTTVTGEGSRGVSRYFETCNRPETTDFLVDSEQKEPLELLTSPSLSEHVERISLYADHNELAAADTRKEQRANLVLALIICFLCFLATLFAHSLLTRMDEPRSMVDPTDQLFLPTNQDDMLLSLWNDESTVSNVSVNVDDLLGDMESLPATQRMTDCSNLLPHVYSGCWKPSKAPPTETFVDAGHTRVTREPGVEVQAAKDIIRHDVSSSKNEVAFLVPIPDADALKRRAARIGRYIRFCQALLVFFRYTMLGIVSKAFLPGIFKSVMTLHFLQEQALFIKNRETANKYKPFMVGNDGACAVDCFENDVANKTPETTSRVHIPAVERIQTHFPVWGKKLKSANVR
eukprot:scaffold8605_cov178-Amphora_coffeaeformis.AAC.6